ncbi:MAG: class II aldolase/adducin family protein [candidate division KSB1 bacterium]|nr:class II aldolase/adducin family protein [candidate division KSB1 bacterium]
MVEYSLRQQICEVGRRMYEKNFVAANDGNISTRLDAGRILTTPTGVSKGFMTPESLVVVDFNGRLLSGGKPSTEILMHLFIYRERPEVHAVIHAHPLYATGFATAGLALEECVTAEIIATLGSIPLAPYGTPSTEKLPETLRPYIHHGDAFLLANHGAVTVGQELWEAYYKMERLEHYAQIIFISRQLGGEKLLGRNQVQELFGLRGRYGQTGLNPGCSTCQDDCIGVGCLNYAHKYDADSEDYLAVVVARIAERVRRLPR